MTVHLSIFAQVLYKYDFEMPVFLLNATLFFI